MDSHGLSGSHGSHRQKLAQLFNKVDSSVLFFSHTQCHQTQRKSMKLATVSVYIALRLQQMRSYFFINFIGWKLYLFLGHLILKRIWDEQITHSNKSKQNVKSGKNNQNSKMKPYLEFVPRNPTLFLICRGESQLLKQKKKNGEW